MVEQVGNDRAGGKELMTPFDLSQRPLLGKDRKGREDSRVEQEGGSLSVVGKVNQVKSDGLRR